MPSLKTLNIVFFTAVAVSIVHYADNTLAFDRYPSGGPGPDPSQDTIWIAWIVFTAVGVAGYLTWRSGNVRLGSALLGFYSISGLIGLGHYSAAGMSELAWWRHAHIWADILCGAAVLAFAIASSRAASARPATTEPQAPARQL